MASIASCPNPPEIPDPIEDNCATVYFNFKYSTSLIEKLCETKRKMDPAFVKDACVMDGVTDLQSDISESLFGWTKTMYTCSKQKKVRFVATFEETASCSASFHLTKSSETNWIGLKPSPVMVITIKGNILVEDKKNKSNWLTKPELYEVYSALLEKLTTGHGFSIQDILIDRIEMTGDDENNLIDDCIKQNPPKTIKEVLEQKQQEIHYFKSENQRLEQEVQKLTKQLQIEELTPGYEDRSFESSLTSSLTGQKTRRKKRNKKSQNVSGNN